MIAGAIWLGPADWYAAKSRMAAVHGDMQGRMEWLNAAAQRDPYNADVHYERGLAWIDQWKPALPEKVRARLLDKAAADLEQAVRLNPQHFLYETALVDVYDRMGREGDALRMATQALKAAPWHEEARLALAMHHHRWMHFQEAERAYLWAREARRPNRPDEFNWLDSYQRLLKDAAAVRMQP